MKDLKAIVLDLVSIVISFLTSLGVFIYGWGLEPKSWFWIIGMSFIGISVAKLIAALAQKGE